MWQWMIHEYPTNDWLYATQPVGTVKNKHKLLMVIVSVSFLDQDYVNRLFLS